MKVAGGPRLAVALSLFGIPSPGTVRPARWLPAFGHGLCFSVRACMGGVLAGRIMGALSAGRSAFELSRRDSQNYRPGWMWYAGCRVVLPVLCYHYWHRGRAPGLLAAPTALIGRGMADWVEIGLAWFFLLSGAALCLQWQGRFDARRYFVGRAAATYPAFWLGFGALFLYGEVLHGNNADIPRWRVIFSVLGLDGYLAPVTVTFYKIGEWFLGVILILYLVFPLLLRCMETAAHRRVLALCMAVLAVVWPLVCPAPWEAGHTVLGRLPAFALGVWFGTLLKKNALPSYRLYIGLAVCPLLWVDEVPRLAVLLVLASVLFWAVYAAGQHVPAPLCPALRRLAGWCYGVYLVHHVLLTLVFLPFVQGHGLPLAGMFPVYLAASFVPAAVLTAMSSPVSKAVKKLA